MLLKEQERMGGVSWQRDEMATHLKPSKPAETSSSRPSLALEQVVPLNSIAGPTYVTAQLLVQQVAYKLSDKIFSYSPETFDLDVAAKQWASQQEPNVYGEPATVVPLQIRSGAGAFALGYIFSKDFDLRKKHIPQTLLAPSLSLLTLRASLDQLSLLYGVASPFVAHVAAVDYSARNGLVTEYETALRMSEELGLGLICSSSANEAQHMALFATLMAAVLPTLHVYDGVRTSRETLRVIDTLGEVGIKDVYGHVAKEIGSLNKRLDDAGKVLELLGHFNNELGTTYEPFEYHGHEAAETVLVVFGSVESQLAQQVVGILAAKGDKVGVINVRLYRPFVEEAFLDKLPASVQKIAVFGQVRDDSSVGDSSVQSALYSDVLTTVSFSGQWARGPAVVEIKYAAGQMHTPTSMASLFHQVMSKGGQATELAQVTELDLLGQTLQCTFWDVDTSAVAKFPSAIGEVLASESANNVYVHKGFDSLIQGGVVRTDIRSSRKPIEAPYAIEQADVVFVGDERLLNELAVLDGVKVGAKVILSLPSFKEEELEKRIDMADRNKILENDLQLFVLDTCYSPALEKHAHVLAALAFFRVTRPEMTVEQLVKLKHIAADQVALGQCADAIDKCLVQIQASALLPSTEEKDNKASAKKSFQLNCFVPFTKEDDEEKVDLDDWQAAAKGLVFKEAYGTKTGLRPDLAVKTHQVYVKENRRLTRHTYERNIFHIEFDFGESDITYKIGEALGIHADNDPKQIEDFMRWYGLKADDLVQVSSREDTDVLETRTVYQSLVQNLDVLGKPPKRFFEALVEHATDEGEKKKLEHLISKEGADELKRRIEVDTITYVDVLEEFPSARPRFHELARMVAPLKRREYSIASAQAVSATSVSLMIVVVDWVDTKGRTRYGQATRYLSQLEAGAAVTVSVKASVMKLPASDTAPLIMAGLGTGLAPFRAFVQYRAMQKAQGKDIGAILLYLGSRHRREEYLYGEEWEAYLDDGVITLLGTAFSRDQPEKIYIQDRMRQTLPDIMQAYLRDGGTFYLCGPTWPVPDVAAVLEEAIAADARAAGRKVDPRKEMERLKEQGRYVLEVY